LTQRTPTIRLVFTGGANVASLVSGHDFTGSSRGAFMALQQTRRIAELTGRARQTTRLPFRVLKGASRARKTRHRRNRIPTRSIHATGTHVTDSTVLARFTGLALA